MEGKNIYYGRVLDNKDPLMLGRLRVFPKHEQYTEFVGTVAEVDKWGPKDNTIFLPLIPYYVSQVPEVDEYVHILYYNSQERTNNSKFYVQGPITKPQNNALENYNSSESMLASGEYMKLSAPLRDTTGTTIPSVYGIYPEPGDNALLGRGSSDVVVKKDEVLVRAGKSLNTQNDGNGLPVRNNNWGFLQISNFDSQKVNLGQEKIVSVENKPVMVKKLVEWEITNEIFMTGFTSGGGTTGGTFYFGNIQLFNLTPNPATTSLVVSPQSPLDDYKGTTPDYSLSFSALTFDQTVNIINTFANNLNDGKINIDGFLQFPPENDEVITGQFPFYVRPTKYNLDILTSTGNTLFNPLVSLYQKVKLHPYEKENGSYLVWSTGVVGQQPTETEITLDVSEYNPTPTSYAALASDNLYLLSHKSQIPAKGDKVNLQTSLYGISQLQFTEEIGERTDPMVRGDQLMKLLNLIVNFLTSHVHNPNKAPIPIGTDGTDIESIRKLMQEADNTILNQNIRLN